MSWIEHKPGALLLWPPADCCSPDVSPGDFAHVGSRVVHFLCLSCTRPKSLPAPPAPGTGRGGLGCVGTQPRAAEGFEFLLSLLGFSSLVAAHFQVTSKKGANPDASGSFHASGSPTAGPQHGSCLGAELWLGVPGSLEFLVTPQMTARSGPLLVTCLFSVEASRILPLSLASSQSDKRPTHASGPISAITSCWPLGLQLLHVDHKSFLSSYGRPASTFHLAVASCTFCAGSQPRFYLNSWFCF